MLDELKRQSIIGAIQRTRDYSCPRCRRILDVRSAVEADFLREGRLVYNYVACGTCWDKLDQKALCVELSAAVGGDVTISVNDGRTL